MPKAENASICQCGCGESFYPFIVTKKGQRVTPIYKRGHHPNCRKQSFGKEEPWNKGLTKETSPAVAKQGLKGPHPWSTWAHVIEKQRNDPVYREKWLAAKRGHTPWNKGKTKDQYLHGIKSGDEHGNWQGGKRGIYDTAELRAFGRSILQRDEYTCQECGDHNHKGRGSRIKLECHHIVAIAENHNLALDPSNAITLCAACHRKTENFGTKLVHKRRKEGH